jgi:hypothetical protein
MVDDSGNRTHRQLGTSPFPVHESSCQSNCGKRRRGLGGISQTDKHDSAALATEASIYGRFSPNRRGLPIAPFPIGDFESEFQF